MTVSENLKLSFKECKKHFKFLLIYSVAIRLLLFSLTIFSEPMSSRYIEFLISYEIYKNPDVFDLVITPLIYFIQMFATEVLVTLPIYLLFFKGKCYISKPLVKEFIIFKAIIFIFYSLLMFTRWHSYSKPVIFATGFLALISVFFKDMVKVRIVTENLSVVNAIKECFKIFETKKFKRFLIFFAVELIFFMFHLIVIVFIIITKPIAYPIYIPKWLFVVSPLIDIFAEPLRISFHLNFFYPKTTL